MGIQNARHYTEAERQEAVSLAEQIGPSAAAERLGIPKGTVSCWGHLARQRRVESGAGAGSSGARPAEALVATSDRLPELAPPPPAVAVPSRSAVQQPGPSPRSAVNPSSPRVVAKIYTPSQRAVVVEHAAAHGVGAAAKKHGVSRFSVRDWTRKAAAAAAGERTDSPVSGPAPVPADERERRILEVWRAHPGLGPSQVRNQLRRANFKVSVHTVRLVLDAHGYVTPKIRREHHDQTYEAVRPNHLWHLDFLHRHVHKQPVYLLLIVDDFSRYIVGSALWQGERAEAVLETFEAAVSRHGRPDKAMSDGGSAFYAWRGVSQFTRLLEELEVDQLIATQPQSNGKLEVLNANVQKELFNVETFFDLGEAQRRRSCLWPASKTTGTKA